MNSVPNSGRQKVIQKMWKELSDEDKQPFIQQAELKKQEYVNKVEEYNRELRKYNMVKSKKLADAQG